LEKLSKAEQILYNICLKQTEELFMKEVENIYKELKYYTPEVSDIHLGYELEVEELEKADNNPDDADGKWWKKVIIDTTVDEDILEFCGNSITGIKNRDIVYVRNTFRTPYLTKEQIEAEGWTHTGGNLLSHSRQDYEKNGVEIEYWELNQNLVIKRKNLYRDGSGRYDGYIQYFKGKCPSINEFRTICKLLNIK